MYGRSRDRCVAGDRLNADMWRETYGQTLYAFAIASPPPEGRTAIPLRHLTLLRAGLARTTSPRTYRTTPHHTPAHTLPAFLTAAPPPYAATWRA